MRLSKQTHHAIQILSHCARARADLVTGPEIAQAEGITEHNVAKIVALLVRGGFVTTLRGRAGGLKLARPAADIRLGDVVRVTEGSRAGRPAPGAQAKKRTVVIESLFDEALEGFIGVLDRHTLADLGIAKAAAAKGAAAQRTAADGAAKKRPPTRRKSASSRPPKAARG